MGLVESVFGECDHLIEYLLCRFMRHPVPHTASYLDIAVIIQLAVYEIFLLLQHDVHFLFAHGASYQV